MSKNPILYVGGSAGGEEYDLRKCFEEVKL